MTRLWWIEVGDESMIRQFGPRDGGSWNWASLIPDWDESVGLESWNCELSGLKVRLGKKNGRMGEEDTG